MSVTMRCSCGATQSIINHYAGQAVLECVQCGEPQEMTDDFDMLWFISFVVKRTRTEIQSKFKDSPTLLKIALDSKSSLEEADYRRKHDGIFGDM